MLLKNIMYLVGCHMELIIINQQKWALNGGISLKKCFFKTFRFG